MRAFKCLTVCKSIGYQIHRLDTFCKCTCHDIKTSTFLPFFKYRTNGTTRRQPKTFSPRLYHVVGPYSPPSFFDTSESAENDTITKTTDIAQTEAESATGVTNTGSGNTTEINNGTGETVATDTT